MNRALIYVLTFLVLTACAALQKAPGPDTSGEVRSSDTAKKQPGPTKAETESLELFTEILDVTLSSKDRRSALPKIEKLYRRIIREYPDAPLAQESYWKLITIQLEDYSPPKYEKAQVLYNEFIKKYPESLLRGFVEDAIGNSYYRHEEWDELFKFSTPAFNEYIEKGNRPRASLIFMYSEASYNLGNLDNAGKGYKIVSELFPEKLVGKKAKSILEKMNKKGP